MTSKLKRLSKSDIEYLDYNWGIFSGCRNLEKGICPVKACWAKGIAMHYKANFPNGFKPTFYPEALESPLYVKKPSRIGVGWVGDIIGYGQEYLPQIFEVIQKCPQHTFIFLTKNGTELNNIDFPKNCWVGITAIDQHAHNEAIVCLDIAKAGVKFISYEPLMGWVSASGAYTLDGISWIILGAQTRPNIYPQLGWIFDLVDQADRAGCKVYLKNNLFPLISREPTCGRMEARILNTLFDDENNIRQEFPK